MIAIVYTQWWEFTRWKCWQLPPGPQRVHLFFHHPKVCEVNYSDWQAFCLSTSKQYSLVDRQNDLSIEKKVGAKDWSCRVNCSLLAMTVVDTWLVFAGARRLKTNSSAHVQRQFNDTLASWSKIASTHSTPLADYAIWRKPHIYIPDLWILKVLWCSCHMG